MKMLQRILIAMAISCSIVHGQGLVNGDFSGYSCDPDWVLWNSANYLFYNDVSCGLTPWKVSHGSPDLNTTTSTGTIPVLYCAGMGSARGFGFTAAGDRNKVGNEGLFQDYTTYKGNRYYLRMYVSTSTANNNGADKIFVALTDGLEQKNVPFSQGNYSLPSPSSKQEVWKAENIESNWVLVEADFVADDDYSQIWFSLQDDDGDTYSYVYDYAMFYFTAANVSCCAISKSYSNTSSLPPVTNAGTIEAGNSVVVTSGQNVVFKSQNGVKLSPGFVASSGSTFVAKAGIACDCSLNGGVVKELCSVFPGDIQYLQSPGGTGVLVPNIFNRDTENWAPRSYGYAVPYNAYYWHLKVVNRSGSLVYETEKTAGVEGFQNGGITWDGGSLSSGTYYLVLDLKNCNGTYSFKDWVTVAGSPHARIAQTDAVAASEKPVATSKKMMKTDGERAPHRAAEALVASNGRLIYPNPVKEEFNYSYPMSQKGALKIELKDSSGNPVETIFDNTEVEGTISGVYNVKHLSRGVYYCTFQSSIGQENVRIVIE